MSTTGIITLIGCVTGSETSGSRTSSDLNSDPRPADKVNAQESPIIIMQLEKTMGNYLGQTIQFLRGISAGPVGLFRNEPGVDIAAANYEGSGCASG